MVEGGGCFGVSSAREVVVAEVGVVGEVPYQLRNLGLSEQIARFSGRIWGRLRTALYRLDCYMSELYRYSVYPFDVCYCTVYIINSSICNACLDSPINDIIEITVTYAWGLGAPEEDPALLISVADCTTVTVTEFSNTSSIIDRWRNKVNGALGSSDRGV
ncbi:hypothetical protein V6N11_010150 [Hibiscus sabdariffa]|uniref:Uncharacterized protein n=1 Tax=Hibiscus sabdariffa TaxID=183260 RepID=A0ABR2PDU9_9ROSI